MAATEAFEAVFAAGVDQLVVQPDSDTKINLTLITLSSDADTLVKLYYGSTYSATKALPAGNLPANGGAFYNVNGAEKPGGIGEPLTIDVVGAANVTLNIQYNLKK